MVMAMRHGSSDRGGVVMNSRKYVGYTPVQIEMLERV
jgi:hypothetical protein